MKLTQLPKAQHKHVMVFGPPKTGKTELVGRLAEKYKLWWFDLEQGIKTLQTRLPAALQDNIEVFQIPDNKMFPIAAETMQEVIKGKRLNICWLHGKSGCSLCMQAGKMAERSAIEANAFTENDILVMDSGTQFTASTLAHILRKMPDDYKPERDDWGQLSAAMFRFYSMVQTAPFHIVIISHESIEKMEDGKTEKIVPAAGSGNFARSVAKYFDEVIYVEIKNSQHKAGSSTLYANNIMTGSRTGTMLEKMDKPSLFEIFDPNFVVASQDKQAIDILKGLKK